MNDLKQTILDLRQLLSKEHSALSQNEIKTRYILIDPILLALGWDVHDLKRVHPEAKIYPSQLRPDYSLRRKDETIAIVEAKRLGRLIHNKSLKTLVISDERRSQIDDYMKLLSRPNLFDEKTLYSVFTDGKLWQIIDYTDENSYIFDIETDDIQDIMDCLAIISYQKLVKN